MHNKEESKVGSNEFEQIFRSNYRSLFHVGYQMSKDVELTKDVIQSLFLDFWDKRDRLKNINNWKAYLQKSMHRKMLEVLKKESQKYETHSMANDNIQPSYETILIQVQSEEKTKERLETAIQKLSQAQREALDLRFKDGMSYEEIAALTGKNKRTIYNQIFSAIQKLRDILALLFYCLFDHL